MRSKGQIALYMIIGMVVLIGVGVFIYSTTSAGDEESYQFIDMPFEVQPLKNLVDGCLDEAIDKGVYYSAMLGGRIYDTSLRLNTDREELNYYYVEGILTTPPKVEITSDLAFFIQNEVGFCLERRKEAGEVSYNFTMGEAEGEVYIEDEEIVVIIDPKVKIFYNNNENRFTLPKYYKKVGYRLGYLHGIAVDFAQGLLDDNNRLSLQLPDDEHLNAKVMIYSDNTVIFTIADENVPRGNTPLVFSFIIQHSATPTPELVYIPDWKLEQGREFAYQVEMEKFEGNVFFYTNDPLVPIDSQTGLINFTPQFAGEFAIRVGVESFAGKNDEQQVNFMVEPH
ncbi:MAG: hypothetical protein QF632_03540, partial [Candidatus Woesearchaeota archaeon]|nr:hypothetical protein [Candidatus Woesearchaeota archaeon]